LSELSDHLEALRQNPRSSEAAEAVRQGAREDGDLSSYAAAFVERARALFQRGLAEEAIQSYVEAALVYEEDLEDANQAANCYQRILEIDGGHRRALYALGLLLHDLGRFRDLIELYQRRLELSVEDGERSTLYLYIAEIWSEKLGDDRAAFESVTAAARLAPTNLRIISRLEQLGQRTGAAAEVAVVIGDLMLNTEDPRVRAGLSLRLAELYSGPLADRDRALACFRSALLDDGGNPELFSEVEDAFREEARFHDLAELLEETTKDRRLGPHVVRLERELARIYEYELGDKKRALAALTAAVRDAPEDKELLDEVMRLGLAAQDLAAVAATYEEVSKRTTNTLLRTYLWLKLGPLYAAMLDRPEQAIRVYEQILEADGDHREARRRLIPLYERIGDRARVALLLDEDVRASEGADTIEPLRRLARHLRDALQDSAGARAAYRRILQHAPGDVEALEAVGPIETSEVSDAGPNPPIELDPSTPDVVLLRSESDVAIQEIDAHDIHAIEVDAEALAARAVPTSEALALVPGPRVVSAVTAAVAPLTPAAKSSASGAERDAPAAFAFEEQLASLQRALEDATRSGERFAEVEALERIKALAEAHDASERAFLAALRLARLEATPARVRAMLGLAARSRSTREALDAYGELSSRLDLDAQVEFGLQLAALEADELHDLPAALKRLAVLHDRAPSVFERRVELLARAEDHATLVEVLLAEGRRVQDENAARTLFERAARILESQLGAPSRAADALLGFLSRAPEDDRIREEAARLLDAADRPAELARLLEEQLYRLEGWERAAMRRRIAAIQLDRIHDVGAAERTLFRGLTEDSRDTETLEALIQIYEREGQWSELVEALVGQIALKKTAAQRNALRRRIAEVAERRLRRTELALQQLGEAVRDDPADLEVLTDLERLRRQDENWAGVVEVLLLRADAHPHPEERANALIEVARIRQEALKDPIGAAEAFKDALRLAPKHKVALDEYAALAERTGQHRDAVEALRELAELLEGPSLAVARARIGRILELHLAKPEEAAVEYQLALDADPSCLEAVTRLRRFREEREQFAEAVVLSMCEAELLRDDRQRAALWIKAAAMARQRLDDRDRAIECYERALGLDPDDLATEALLGELYLGKGDAERALIHLSRASRGLRRSDQERSLALTIAAGQAAEQLGRDPEARAAYEAALEVSPRAKEPLLRLSALLERAGDSARAYDVSAVLILHHEVALPPIERAAIYRRMASAKQRLRDLSAAVRLAKKAQGLAPADPKPIALLADLLEESGEAPEAAGHLKRLAVMVEGAERRAVLIRAAKLYAEQASDPAKAAAILAEARVDWPNDLQIAELYATLQDALGDPRAAADALAVAARQVEGPQRAEVLVRAARFAAGSPRDRAEAKKLFSEATRLVPTHVEALAELERMLEFDGDRLELAELHERAANAQLGDPNASAELRTRAALRHFEAAKVLYRFRLKRPDDALRMARAVRTLARAQPGQEAGVGQDAPQDAGQEEYGRLLDEARAASGADRDRRQELLREATDLWQEVAESRPGLVDALHRLFALRVEAGQTNLARVPAEILTVLGQASAGEQRWLAELSPAARSGAPAAAPPPGHPSEAGSVLRALFARLGHAPLVAFDDVLAPEPRLKKRDRLDPAQLDPSLRAALDHAAAILGVERPWVYARDDAPLSVQPVFAEGKPALFVSRPNVAALGPDGARFMVGRALSLLGPRSMSLAVVPLDALREGLEGLVRERLPAAAVLSDLKRSKKRGRALEKAIAPNLREELAAEVVAWLSQAPRRTLFEEREAVFRTAERAGLLVAGSLVAAVDAMRATRGRVEHDWFVPLVEFASSRAFAGLLAHA
jgi:tetratricopeptide (TPR) repeat protein